MTQTHLKYTSVYIYTQTKKEIESGRERRDLFEAVTQSMERCLWEKTERCVVGERCLAFESFPCSIKQTDRLSNSQTDRQTKR